MTFNELPEEIKTKVALIYANFSVTLSEDRRKHFRKVNARLIQQPIGVTTDGKLLIRGDVVFKLQDQFGIPLDIQLLIHIDKEYFQVTWIPYMMAANNAKRSKRKTLLEIKNAIEGGWGVTFMQNIMLLNEHFANKMVWNKK